MKLQKVLLFLCAVSIGTSSARSLCGKILVDPDCGGLVGVTKEDIVVTGQFVDGQKLKLVNDFVKPIETPSRWGLIPPKIEKVKTEEIKEDKDTILITDVFGKEDKKKDEKKDLEDLDKFLEKHPTTTTKVEHLMVPTEDTDDGLYKFDKIEEFKKDTETIFIKDSDDDGLWKPERDNVLVGKFDDGSYKPETPLFIYNQPIVAADPCTLCAEQNIETPSVIAEKPYYFETSSQILEQPTVIQEPCDDDDIKTRVPIIVNEPGWVTPHRILEEPKIIAPIETITPPVQNILRNDGINFVTGPLRTPNVIIPETPQFFVPRDTITPPVQNVIRSEPTFIQPTTLVEPCEEPSLVLDTKRTLINEPILPAVPVPQFVVPEETIHPAVQNVIRNDPSIRFEVARPETVVRTEVIGKTTVFEEPCDDTKVIVDTPTQFVRREEVIRPPVQHIVREEPSSFYIDAPKPEFVVREAPQVVVRREPYITAPIFRKEEIIRPAVQNVVRNENVILSAPTIINGAVLNEPCDPILENNFLIHK